MKPTTYQFVMRGVDYHVKFTRDNAYNLYRGEELLLSGQLDRDDSVLRYCMDWVAEHPSKS